MGKLHRSAASVGFRGDDLEPGEITARLGVEPDVGVAKGGTWRTESGVEKVAHSGYWQLQTPRRQPADLDAQINELFDRASDDLAAWRHFAGRFRGTVFCGLFLAEGNEGLTLRPETLVRIGERGLALDFDIYAPDLPD